MKVLSLFMVLFLVACATKPTRFTELYVGMPKKDVIETLGKPFSAAAQQGAEYLIYSYNRGPISGEAGPGGPQDYFVRIVNGKVHEYGRLGDFGSTMPVGHEVNVNVRQGASHK